MRVAQISDVHLFADRDGRLQGYDTYREFDRVLPRLSSGTRRNWTLSG